MPGKLTQLFDRGARTRVVLVIVAAAISGVLVAALARANGVLFGSSFAGRVAFWGALLCCTREILFRKDLTARFDWGAVRRQVRPDWLFFVGLFTYQSVLLLIFISIDQRVILATSTSSDLVRLLTRKIPAAITEEAFFRVALCELLSGLTPGYLVPLSTSLAFSLAHLADISSSQSQLVYWSNVLNIVFAFLFGYFAATRYIRTRNAAYVMALHSWVGVQETILRQIARAFMGGLRL